MEGIPMTGKGPERTGAESADEISNEEEKLWAELELAMAEGKTEEVERIQKRLGELKSKMGIPAEDKERPIAPPEAEVLRQTTEPLAAPEVAQTRESAQTSEAAQISESASIPEASKPEPVPEPTPEQAPPTPEPQPPVPEPQEPAPAPAEIPEELKGKPRKELERELKKVDKRLGKLRGLFGNKTKQEEDEIRELETRKQQLEAIIAATPRESQVVSKEIKKIDKEIKRLEGLFIKTKPEEDRLNELRQNKQNLEDELRLAEARERKAEEPKEEVAEETKETKDKKTRSREEVMKEARETLKRALEYLRSLTKEEKEELGELLGEAVEESLPVLLKFLEKSGALEKRAVVKMVVDTVVGNLEKLEEDKFPHLHAWKRENSAAFEGLKKDLTEALLEEDEDKRNQKVKEIFTKHKIEGETLKEMNSIAGVINLLHKELKLKGALSEEEKAKMKKEVEALRGKSGELKDKLLAGAGFAGLMLVLAFFLVVILELSIIDAMLGRKHNK